MSDRIRQLEDAVAILQSTLSSEPHPLLSRELLKVKSSIELHAAIDDQLAAQSGASGGSSTSTSTAKQDPEEEEESVMDAFGTLAIRDDGAATFYGRSAGSEVRGRFLFFFVCVNLNHTCPDVKTLPLESFFTCLHATACTLKPESINCKFDTSKPFFLISKVVVVVLISAPLAHTLTG